MTPTEKLADEIENAGAVRLLDPAFADCDRFLTDEEEHLIVAALRAYRALPMASEIMRQFIERQREKLPSIEGAGNWRSGYTAALDNMAIVLDAAPPTMAWQPIETAPKDGTAFLAHMKENDDLSPVILQWSFVKETWVVSWDGANIGQDWGDEPTHWMPLPDAPVLTSGKPPHEGQ